MSDQNTIWIRDTLVPLIVKKEKSMLQSANDVNLKDLSIERFENNGVFLLTICYKLTIVLDIGNGNEHRFSVFIKIAPDYGEEQVPLFESKFHYEILAYDEILPEVNASVQFPTLYHWERNDERTAIAISDFADNQYQMSKSVVNLSLDHILATMQALGRFHGAMYAMKFTKSKQFNSLRSKLAGNVGGQISNVDFNLMVKLGLQRALQSFRKRNEEATTIDTVPETFVCDLEKLLIEKRVDYTRKLFIPREPLAIICHGDFLRNNIAFKYDAKTGLATDAMFFDFQTVCYVSPMLDFGMFMANSTAFDMRRKHFDEIFQVYHDAVINQFTAETQLHQSDVPNYLSRDAFIMDYVRFAPYCFHIAAFYLPELIEPSGHSSFDAPLEMAIEILTMGGAAVDRETFAQINEIYRMCVKYNFQLSKLIADDV